MCKYDIIGEILKSLTSSDFLTVLNYYGIEIRKNSILCPFHNDQHYGSCYISKSGKTAHCYSCGKIFNAIDLVQLYEGLDFVDAVEYLWCIILGNIMEEETQEERFILSFKDLELIGLGHASAHTVPIEVGCYHYLDADDLPDDCKIDHSERDDEGYCVAKRYQSTSSLMSLYKEDPVSILDIMLGKAYETVDFYDAEIENLRSNMRMFNYTGLYDAVLAPDLPDSTNLYETCVKTKIEYEKKKHRAEKICSKLENEKLSIMEKAS